MWTLFQRRHIDGQQAHEKMSNITNIREMQIKTTMTPDTCQNDSYHKDNKQVLARIYSRGKPCALLVGMEISVSP